MSDARERVHRIVCETLGLVAVSDVQRITEDLGADSLEAVEVIVALESEFDIDLPADADGETVGDLVALVEKML